MGSQSKGEHCICFIELFMVNFNVLENVFFHNYTRKHREHNEAKGGTIRTILCCCSKLHPKSCLVWLFDSVWDIQVLLTTSQATTFSLPEAIFAPGAAHVCIIKLTELLGLQCHETLTVKQHTHVDLFVSAIW